MKVIILLSWVCAVAVAFPVPPYRKVAQATETGKLVNAMQWESCNALLGCPNGQDCVCIGASCQCVPIVFTPCESPCPFGLVCMCTAATCQCSANYPWNSAAIQRGPQQPRVNNAAIRGPQQPLVNTATDQQFPVVDGIGELTNMLQQGGEGGAAGGGGYGYGHGGGYGYGGGQDLNNAADQLQRYPQAAVQDECGGCASDYICCCKGAPYGCMCVWNGDGRASCGGQWITDPNWPWQG